VAVWIGASAAGTVAARGHERVLQREGVGLQLRGDLIDLAGLADEHAVYGLLAYAGVREADGFAARVHCCMGFSPSRCAAASISSSVASHSVSPSTPRTSRTLARFSAMAMQSFSVSRASS